MATETAFYDGCSCNSTYEKYCKVLVQAFNDIEETGEEVTEERKMCMLLKGLNDPRCESAKNTIHILTSLRNNIANAMDMLAEVLGNIVSFTNPAKRNVSSQGTTHAPSRGGRGDRGRGYGDGRGGRGGRSNQGRGGG